MSINLISDMTTRAMADTLDRLAKRQTVVAENVANIDTPGYKTKDVEFGPVLGEVLGAEHAQGAGELRRTDPRHMAGTGLAGGGRIYEVEGLPSREDQNNVSLDHEAAKISEIALKFAATAQMYVLENRGIRTAILEGR